MCVYISTSYHVFFKYAFLQLHAHKRIIVMRKEQLKASNFILHLSFYHFGDGKKAMVNGNPFRSLEHLIYSDKLILVYIVIITIVCSCKLIVSI